MGMSSSQARLLSLTARMHDIEYRAQRLEAQKLQLANESDKAYADYLRVLDAKKIQYKAISSDGSVVFKDASMNVLQNGSIPGYRGEHSSFNLFLQDQDGKIMVTPAVANAYRLSTTASVNPNMDAYVHEVTGKDKTVPVYKTVSVTDTESVASFTPISNSNIQTPVKDIQHSYAAVANEEGGIDYEALSSYATFNTAHTASTSGAASIGDGSSITAGSTYTINSAEELKALMNNATGANTAGTKFILTNDIDLSGINWTGIQNFAGTFDGNGYTIKNLTGSQGLFASTSGATIMNVGLEGVNVDTSSSNVGGLIGNCTNSNIGNCYVKGSIKGGDSTGGLIGYYNATSGTPTISNVYSQSTVIGNDNVGGLLGQTHSRNCDFNIANAYAVGDVKGGTKVGGFAGYMYNDQDTDGLNGQETDIQNAYAAGTVEGNSTVGGFFGEYLYWGDGGDYCYLTGLSSSTKITHCGDSMLGAMAGKITISLSAGLGYTSEDQKYVNFVNSSYTTTSGASSPYGAIYDHEGNDVTSLLTSSGSAGLIEINMAGSIPSIEADGSGAYMSNILGVLTKAGLFDACDDTEESESSVSDMKSKIANFLRRFNDNNADNTKLWYLNIAMCDYLNNGSESDKTLAQALLNDINGTGTSNTSSYQNGAALTGAVKRGAGAEWTVDGTHTLISGNVDIPSINTIADQVYYAMKKAGKSIDNSTVRTYFNNNYGSLSDTDKITLANINDKISSGENLVVLFNAIQNNYRYDNSDKYSDPELPYNINVATNDQTVSFTHGMKDEEQVDYYKWDLTDTDISNAITMWALSQKGVIVVNENQASNYEYLKNVIEVGHAVLTTFDPSKASVLATMSADEIINMPEAEYNDLMGIENTSVSTETLVHEVQDEIGLRKAEAKYEADMRQIDMKDRRYDAELAAVDTERNAIKEEMETLKNVIKDNVEMNFKLFG